MSTLSDKPRRTLEVDARTFAIEQHAAAGVRYGEQPFEYHLDAVAQVLRDHGHEGVYGLIAAAYLHDVVEDTPVTIEQVGEEFGSIVRDYVDALTDMKVGADGESLGNRTARQTLTYAKLRTIALSRGDAVVNLKLADRIANIEESFRITSHHLGMYYTDHEWFCSQIAPAGGDPAMWARLNHLVEQMPPVLARETARKKAERQVAHEARLHESKARHTLERIAEKFDATHDFSFKESCALLCFVGSQSHGTTIERTDPNGFDDVDLMAVVLPPVHYALGLHDFDNWVGQWEELDVVVYGFAKFVRLLVKENPNVLGTLWLRDQDYLIRREAFIRLQENRQLFATRAAHASFAGYANGQFVRMTSYSPEIQAEIDDLTAKLEACGWHLQDVMDKRSVPMPYGGTTAEEANEWANRLRHLRAKYHQAYMGEKRRNLVVKHGYDTKNAAHLIRLLRMCAEFLQTGEMQVYRTADAEELKSIKRGEWALDDVKALAQKLFGEAEAARDASMLPYEPDRLAISQLLASITLNRYALGVK